jgi:hypothetical protein
MADLTNQIQTIDLTLWGSLQAIQSNLTASATKLLEVATDALIDPTVADPSGAYQVL